MDAGTVLGELKLSRDKQEAVIAGTEAGYELQKTRDRLEAEESDPKKLEERFKAEKDVIRQKYNRKFRGDAARAYEQKFKRESGYQDALVLRQQLNLLAEGHRAGVEENEGLSLRMIGEGVSDLQFRDIQKTQMEVIEASGRAGAYNAHQIAILKNGWLDQSKQAHESAGLRAKVDAAAYPIIDDPSLTQAEKVEIAMMLDPEIREEVVRKVEFYGGVEARRKAEAYATLYDTTNDQIIAGDLTDPDSLPSSLTHKDRSLFMRMLADPAFNTGTKPQVWADLWKMAADDPSAFAKANLQKPRSDGELSREHYSELRGVQREIRSGNSSAGKNAWREGQLGRLNRRMDRMELQGLGEFDPNQKASIQLAFMDAMTALQNETGERPTPEQGEEVINALLQQKKYLVPSSLWNWTWAAFGEYKEPHEMTPEMVGRVLKNPPEELRIEAFNELVEAGMEEPSDEAVATYIRDVLKLYGAGID
jgi:hypothetical protein